MLQSGSPDVPPHARCQPGCCLRMVLRRLHESFHGQRGFGRLFQVRSFSGSCYQLCILRLNFKGSQVMFVCIPDATYTERYMGDASIESYSDVTKKLDNFKTTRLLLMHGLMDGEPDSESVKHSTSLDNVHFQNSAILIEELQNRGIDFDLMIYPNQAHSLGQRTAHVVGKMTQFLKNCFTTEK